MTRTPRDVLHLWLEAFNSANADALADLYHPRAVNHQTPNEPVEGREAIRAMFECEFARADMLCITEHIFEDRDWVILEWKDPQGLRGCGIFRVRDGLIVFQRGYWDKLSFIRLHGRGSGF